MNSDIPLSIEGLYKQYSPQGDWVVNDVSFAMKPGEIFGLLGPNGAGKTTIISIITTLVNASKGSVSVFGCDVNKHPLQAKRMLGMVPQELVSHGFFTVEEVLNFHSGYYGIHNNIKYIDYLLEHLGLDEHRKKKVPSLSGGMKRRLLIAKALVHKPKLLLLDEPTAGVDIALRVSLWKFVRELNAQGTSILLTTHYLEEAEELCDRIGVIHQGRLKTVDTTNELILGATKRRMTLTLKSPLAARIQHDWIVDQSERTIAVEVPSQSSLGEVCDALSIDPHLICDVQIKEGNLEEAFSNLVGF